MKRLIFLLLLAGCTRQIERPEPVVVPVETAVPVSLPCIPAIYDSIRPDYVDTDDKLKAAGDAADRVQLLWAGREQRIRREIENEIVIAGCAKG